MSGINPYDYMQQISVQMDTLKTRDEIEIVLDEIEYLFEVIPKVRVLKAWHSVTPVRNEITIGPFVSVRDDHLAYFGQVLQGFYVPDLTSTGWNENLQLNYSCSIEGFGK